MRVLRIFRLIRVIRISRFMKPYIGIFYETLLLARHSIPMLISYSVFCTIVSSALIYSAEERSGTFVSMFEAMYWCVVTQTTLGYGDIKIATEWGRLLACITAYAGIFQITIMINVMGSCFDEAYIRYLATKEKDFKKELGLGLQESRRGSLIGECISSAGRNSAIVKSGTLPLSSSKGFSKTDTKQLLNKIVKLASSLVDLETGNGKSIFSCDKRMALIFDIKKLLEEIIRSKKLRKVNHTYTADISKRKQSSGLEVILENGMD